MIVQKGTEWECDICHEVFGRVENAIYHDFKEHHQEVKKDVNLIDKRISFTAADVLPMKLFLIDGLVDQIKKGYIPPVHISLCPTNKCNQNCSFCSYSERDRNLEMSYAQAINILETFKHLGTKAVDLTGGGEPLLYPWINEVIDYISTNDMQLSLTTNGLLLRYIHDRISMFTWIRISVSDYTPWENIEKIIPYIDDNTSVDWNISYVLTRKPNYDLFMKVVVLANNVNCITHVRAVSDLLDLKHLPPIDRYRLYLDYDAVDDSKVIYQNRQKYSLGAKKCLISLLRPNIDAKGDVYPCCGTQYAIEANPARNFAPTFNMGNNYKDIWAHQKYFDGSVCTKCYYYGYNEVLNVLQNPEVKHVEFV